MQQLLRPYVTSGVAVVGASVIGVTTMPIQLSDLAVSPSELPVSPVHQPDLRLAANTSDVLVTWDELFSNTAANMANLGQGVDPGSLPTELGLMLSAVGPFVTVANAYNEIMAAIVADPANTLSILLNAPATLINAWLNGTDTITLFGITVPAFNGLLVDAQPFEIDLSLGQVLGTIDLGEQSLTEILSGVGIGDLPIGTLATSLLDGLGLGSQTPLDLINAIGIGTQPAAELVSGLLDAMGLG